MPDTPVTDLDRYDTDGRYLCYHVARDERRPEYERHRAEVRDLCGLGRGGSVLEIGCGTGAHLPHFWRTVGTLGRVAAVDGSTKMLAVARERLERDGVPLRSPETPGVELVHGRLGEVDVSGRPFDVVLADRLLGHLADPVCGLQVLASTVRPGGRVVVVNLLNAATTVNLGPGLEQRRLANKVLSWRAERGTTNPWTAAVLPSLARRAGLVPIAAQCWTFTCASLAETYPHTPLLDYGDHAHADGAISAHEACLWRERLREVDAAGEFAATFTVRADLLKVPTSER